MVKALGKLWDMYEETRHGRVVDTLDYMEKKFEYEDQIAKLHLDLRNAQDELAKEVEEKQVTLAHKAKAEQALMDARAELEEKRITDATTCKMQKCLLIKAEKDKVQYKEEKRKLECSIADLLKQNEGYMAKFKKIKELADIN
jgi:hypothetical protein